jgi:L-amino acid N-acyltransferase YncA
MSDDAKMSVRPLERDDFDRLRAFFARIPESDRTFFKDDVLDPAVVAGWLHDQRGRRLVAVDASDGTIIGYAAVRPGFGWSSHVGELRLVVDPSRRRGGVGKTLARAGLVTAIEMGLAKVVVDVIADHEGTIGLFSSLGFQAEALLRDHVRDREGLVHDLIIMGHLVEDTWSAMATAGLEDYMQG